jgi:hypothetical protein
MASGENDVVVLTRQELFYRIWTTAMRHVGPDLGVSDVGLKKICKRFNIPTPPLGYWAKKEAGKAPKRPPLPKLDDTDFEGIKFWPNGTQTSGASSSEVEALIVQERHSTDRIVVAPTLESPHSLVEATDKSICAASPGDEEHWRY